MRYFGILAAFGVFASMPLHAEDITDLVRAEAATPSVIFSVCAKLAAQSHNPKFECPYKGNNGYAIDEMPEEVLETKLGVPAGAKTLENDAFKVVENESDAALPITDFDGRNVLYHLMDARAYYMDLAQKTGIASQAFNHKITVRVRVNHEPNPFLHFSKVPHANDSGYMPFGGAPELWFFARKSGFHDFSLYNFFTSEALAAIEKTWWAVGVGALEEGLKDYDGGMDPSKLPNVVYHETFHYSTDAPELIHMVWAGLPTAEDYANYFAASHYGSPKLADLGAYSGRLYKRDYHKVHDITHFQPATYNSKAFGPSMLWKVREMIGADRADQVIWTSIAKLPRVSGEASASEVDAESAIISAVRESTLLSMDERAAVVTEIQKHDKSYLVLDQIFGNKPLPQPKPEPAPTEEDITDAASAYNEVLAEAPAELQQMGVTLSKDESGELDQRIAALKAQPSKPGFAARVLGALRTFGVKAGQYASYAGAAVESAASAPATFGTDFLTGLAFGKSRFTDGVAAFKPGTAEDLVGVAGAVPATYFFNVGVVARGHSFSGYVSEFGLGTNEIMQLFCSRPEAQIAIGADRTKLTPLQKTCSTDSKIADDVRRYSAKGGAEASKKLRGLFARKGDKPVPPPPAKADAKPTPELETFGRGWSCFGFMPPAK